MNNKFKKFLSFFVAFAIFASEILTVNVCSVLAKSNKTYYTVDTSGIDSSTTTVWDLMGLASSDTASTGSVSASVGSGNITYSFAKGSSLTNEQNLNSTIEVSFASGSTEKCTAKLNAKKQSEITAMNYLKIPAEVNDTLYVYASTLNGENSAGLALCTGYDSSSKKYTNESQITGADKTTTIQECKIVVGNVFNESSTNYVYIINDKGVGTDSVHIAAIARVRNGSSTKPSITLTPAEASIEVGGTTTLTATANNAGDNPEITWSSSNESVATVDNGTVTGVAAGTATITAKITVDSKTYSAEAKITVTEAATYTVSGTVTANRIPETYGITLSGNSANGDASQGVKLETNIMDTLGADDITSVTFTGTEDGATAKDATIGSDGKYSISLKAGAYKISVVTKYGTYDDSYEVSETATNNIEFNAAKAKVEFKSNIKDHKGKFTVTDDTTNKTIATLLDKTYYTENGVIVGDDSDDNKGTRDRAASITRELLLPVGSYTVKYNAPSGTTNYTMTDVSFTVDSSDSSAQKVSLKLIPNPDTISADDYNAEVNGSITASKDGNTYTASSSNAENGFVVEGSSLNGTSGYVKFIVGEGKTVNAVIDTGSQACMLYNLDGNVTINSTESCIATDSDYNNYNILLGAGTYVLTSMNSTAATFNSIKFKSGSVFEEPQTKTATDSEGNEKILLIGQYNSSSDPDGTELANYNEFAIFISRNESYLASTTYINQESVNNEVQASVSEIDDYSSSLKHGEKVYGYKVTKYTGSEDGYDIIAVSTPYVYRQITDAYGDTTATYAGKAGGTTYYYGLYADGISADGTYYMCCGSRKSGGTWMLDKPVQIGSNSSNTTTE